MNGDRTRSWGRRTLPFAARPIVAIVVAVLLWEAVIKLFNVPPYVIPTPESTVAFVWDDWSQLQPLFFQTLSEVVLGFLVGVGVGVFLAVLMSEVKVLNTTLYPLIITSQAAPIVAIAPPLVIILGFGMLPKLVIVGLCVFFPIVVNMLSALNSVDPEMLALVKSIETSRLRLLALVKLPSALGPLCAALRIGATFAVTGAVIGEWTATATRGLGNNILTQESALNTPAVFGEVIMLTGIGIAGFLLMSLLERFVIPWRRRSTARGLLRSRFRRRLVSGGAPSVTTRVGAPGSTFAAGVATAAPLQPPADRSVVQGVLR